jgi:hypothetical protein
MPRRIDAFKFLGYAVPEQFLPAKLKPGRSPRIIWRLPAGHSHRRTSGGTAKSHVAYHIEAKVLGGSQNSASAVQFISANSLSGAAFRRLK